MLWDVCGALPTRWAAQQEDPEHPGASGWGRPPMKPEFRNALLGVGVIIAFALVSAVSALLGARGCKGDPVQILPVGIDAGPGDLEIASRLDGAVQAEEARIHELEAQHVREIAAMQDQKPRAYEA